MRDAMVDDKPVETRSNMDRFSAHARQQLENGMPATQTSIASWAQQFGLPKADAFVLVYEIQEARDQATQPRR